MEGRRLVAVPTEPAGLSVASEREGDAHVIVLAGDLELATIGAVEAALESVESSDCRRILFDLSRLEFLDSTGIHLLMSVHQRCQARGRSLALVPPAGPARRALEVSGVLTVLPSSEVAA
jgi:anti-sigma B factor antagonist